MKYYIRFFISCLILITFLSKKGNDYNVVYQEFKDWKNYYIWLNIEVYSTIEYFSYKYRINKSLVLAVIQQESGSYCDNKLEKMIKVRSYAGAIGIMQIMPFHVEDFKQLYDYRTNIEKGIWYLSKCLKKSKYNIVEACRMYNAGLNSKRWKYRNWAYTKRIYIDLYKSGSLI